MWTVGVAVRWAANVYTWQWRLLLPLSGVLELAAFLIFFRAVSQHRPEASGKGRLEPWIWVVISASTGLMLTLIAKLTACFYLALRGASPVLSHILDQRYPVLVAWGFLVPFVWGFSTKWNSVPWSQTNSFPTALGCAGGERCGRSFDALGMGS